MASTTRIDGSLPAAGAATRGTVFSGGWAVDYDFTPDRVVPTGQPHRIASRGFPAPFDSDLDGVLRGQGAFAGFLYLFKAGHYLRLIESTMTVDGVATPIAAAWGLPSGWTHVDAVFPGGGVKSGFAYFFRGGEYVRYQWSTDASGPVKTVAPNWHTASPFDANIDGQILGLGPFGTKAYLFKRVSVPAGSATIETPIYCRYDFDGEVVDHTVTDPNEVVRIWSGLLPMLDAGAAVDVALRWCDSALAAVDGRLAGVASASTDAALLHHFRSATPSTAELTFIRGHMANIRARVAAIPEDFFWSETLPGDAAASTVSFRQGTVPPPHSRSITISNLFSTFHGPNGRAAVLIHEAAHFEIGGRPDGTAPHIGEASPEYATMSAADARENPSSYASFAQETFFGVDHRFGAGRPGE